MPHHLNPRKHNLSMLQSRCRSPAEHSLSVPHHLQLMPHRRNNWGTAYQCLSLVFAASLEHNFSQKLLACSANNGSQGTPRVMILSIVLIKSAYGLKAGHQQRMPLTPPHRAHLSRKVHETNAPLIAQPISATHYDSGDTTARSCQCLIKCARERLHFTELG